MKGLLKATERVIDAAIAVHRELGPGLLKEVYEAALCHEFGLARIPYVRRPRLPAIYKGRTVGEFRPDFILEDRLVLEVRSVERLDAGAGAEVLTVLRASGRKAGLLINFHERLLIDGIKRVVLP